MDRGLVYPGAIPLETDLLFAEQAAMVGLSKLAAAMLGTSTVVNGFAVTQTGPASMSVQVAPGEIYQNVNLEGTAYSSLPADTTHTILKQGISLDTVLLALTAPGTGGFSINYLIQATFAETDSVPVVLPYYNASNPATAYSGPANAGTAQNTRRLGKVTLSAKAGIAAATGTQSTPAPDAGNVGLYVVTVANGAVSVVNANISQLATAPIINSSLLGLTPAFTAPLGVAPATSPGQAPQLSQVLSSYGVRGLAGANNNGTPNTQFDFKADLVAFRNPTTGATSVVSNVTTITNNVLTAGPAVNGRDQAGAFTASSWLHFYFIYNPTTLTVATISSANAPPTGPTLPAGYTAWAYIGAVFFSGASALANGFFRGSWFTYSTPVAVVSGGTQTLRTAVSLTTSIPPNALQLRPRISSLQVTSNASGTYSAQVTLEVVTALTAYLYGLAGTAGASLNMFAYGGTTVLPNVGQNVNYFITMTSGTAPAVTIAIDGYSNPNGGE